MKYLQLMVSALLMACLLFSTSLAQAGKDTIDGFKAIKFGSNAEQLKRLGLKCDEDGKRCSTPFQTKYTETLFGYYPLYMGVRLDNDKTTSINVHIGTTTDNLIKLYQAALGKPGTYDYKAYSMNIYRAYYWVLKNKTSIVVLQNLDDPNNDHIFGTDTITASAEYKNKSETKMLMEDVKQSAAKAKDF